jgi:hypothetical protein
VPVLHETLCQDFRKARSVNQTSNGYVSKVPTLTEPAGDAATATGASVIDLANGAPQVQNALLIVPYGTGSDTNTFSCRVIGWKRVPGVQGTNHALWVPVTLLEIACTLSTPTGVAGTPIVAAELFADTITVTKGSTLSGEAPSETLVSPADNTIAHCVVDVKGFTKVELSFTTGGSATDCNALVALF